MRTPMKTREKKFHTPLWWGALCAAGVVAYGLYAHAHHPRAQMYVGQLDTTHSVQVAIGFAPGGTGGSDLSGGAAPNGTGGGWGGGWGGISCGGCGAGNAGGGGDGGGGAPGGGNR